MLSENILWNDIYIKQYIYIYIYIYIKQYIYMYVYNKNYIPVVPRKAVAEVSKIGNL